MLVTDDKRANEEDGVTANTSAGETPPPYEPAPSSPTGDSSTRPAGSRVAPPNIPATNYTKIKRKNTSIKGTYVIDAGLMVPDELLSLPETTSSTCDCSDDGTVDDSSRKSLHLECINSSITAEVWLVDSEEGSRQEPDRKRTELELRSKNGSLNLKLYSTSELPFSLIANAKNASATVALPSDFVGPITLTTVNGSVSLSGPMRSRLVTFSEEDGIRKCFIGDYRRAEYSGRYNWTGSMAEIGSINGKVKLSFVDEVEQSSSDSTGFWGRFFGIM